MSTTETAKPATDGLPRLFHKYITRNSEYLVKDGVCVEVRSRHSSDGQKEHAAVKQRVVGRVRWRREGSPDVLRGALPEIGDSLLLGVAENAILTSAIRRIESGKDHAEP